MLATLGQTIPTGPSWMHEIKWDGMRLLADVADGAVRLTSRTERDVTSSFPELAGLTAVAPDVLLDGEALVLRDGIPSFHALTSRMHVVAPAPELVAAAPVTFVIFDLLRLDGHSLLGLPLRERRALLEALDLAMPSWHLSPSFDDGEALLAATREQGLEGVMSKRLTSVYAPGVRSGEWLKFPHRPTESYVVGGWRPESTGSSRLGAVLVGSPSAEGLRYRGRTGSGLAGAAGDALRGLLVEAASSPFVSEVPRVDAAGATWVEPAVVIDIASLGPGDDGRLRQPAFQRVRPDLTPADLLAPADPTTEARDGGRSARSDAVRASGAKTRGTQSEETQPDVQPASGPDPMGASSGAPDAEADGERRRGARPAGWSEPASDPPAGRAAPEPTTPADPQPAPAKTRLTNPDKVLYPATGTTKAEVVAYYLAVADRLLPQLRDRPVTRLRWPHGVDGDHFFEKNVPRGLPESIGRVTLPSPGSTKDRELVTYPLVRTADDLAVLANLSALELHTPQWRVGAIGPDGVGTALAPDRLVIDLDPGPPAGLRECAQVALLVRDRLRDIGFACEPVTSGSKGLQLYAPLDGSRDADEVREIARLLAELLTAEHPDLVLSSMRRDLRPGKVLLDWSQNSASKTTITPWSLRGRAKPWVACPRTWAEVEAGAAGEPFEQVLFTDALAR